MKEILNYSLVDAGSFRITIGMIVGVLIVLLASKAVIEFLRYIFKKRTKANPENSDRHQSIFLLITYFIWVLTVVLVLENLGVQISFLLAGSAALLVGIGLGIQQIFNDIISGIIILVEGNLKPNDVVEVDGLIGRVNEINLRTSVIYTRDGIYIIVPNHKFINENVINWSHHSKATRFRINVGVAYDSDEELVRNILLDCLKEQKLVITDDPENYPIFARIINFGDSSIDFEMLFWSNDIFFIEGTKSNIRFAILKKFRENNIVIPFPQRDLNIKTNSNFEVSS